MMKIKNIVVIAVVIAVSQIVGASTSGDVEKMQNPFKIICSLQGPLVAIQNCSDAVLNKQITIQSLNFAIDFLEEQQQKLSGIDERTCCKINDILLNALIQKGNKGPSVPPCKADQVKADIAEATKVWNGERD